MTDKYCENYASQNCIPYFNLNFATLSDADLFIMQSLVEQIYRTDIFKAVETAQHLKSLSRTYCYKYYPLDKSLEPKIYDQNELVALFFISCIVDNPYDIVPCTPENEHECSQYTIDENGLPFHVKLDETDKSFVIILKGATFYNQLYGALELAKDYKSRGKQYYYYMQTPKWFKEDMQFNVSMPGHRLILLWYNRDYVLHLN